MHAKFYLQCKIPLLTASAIRCPSHDHHSLTHSLTSRSYVAQLSRFVFDLAVKFKILKPWGPSNDVESGHVNTRAEAERRR